VNDLSVILSREKSVGRLRVTVVKNGCKCPIGYGEDYADRRACEIEVFCR